MELNKSDVPANMGCPICGELKQVKLNKKNKPYWQCHTCLIQVFVRGEIGVNLMKNLKNNPNLISKLNSDAKTDLGTALNLYGRIYLIKNEIREIGKNEILFSENPRKLKLKTKLSELELSLAKILEGF